MKAVFHSDTHDIRAIDDPAVYDIIRGSTRVITTYNKLMRYYEEGGRDIGVVLISPNDVSFQHLPLFCRYFGIELYSLPHGSEDILSSMFHRKYINIIGLYRNDESCERMMDWIRGSAD